MLSSIFKGMVSKDFIEIREIDNRGKAKQYFLKLQELENYEIPQDKNVYYGVYSRARKSGTAASCKDTGALYLDFDCMNLGQVKEAIAATGLPNPSIYVNSGHGIHTYWLLKNRAGIEAVKVIKAMAVVTGADTKATDVARVLRLPNSLNVKKTPIKCEVIESNNIRYELDMFKELLREFLIEEVQQDLGEIIELKNCNMTCIKEMVKGVEKGYRNFALCKITSWLKLRGVSKNRTLEIVKEINKRNSPPEIKSTLESSFNKIWSDNYRFLGCKFADNDLNKKNKIFCGAGECEYHSKQSIQLINEEGTSYIDNKIFKSTVYPNIKGLTLAIYFTIARAGSDGLTRKHLADIVERAEKDRTLLSSIKMLNDIEYIEIIRAKNRNAGKEDIIRIKQLSNYGRGYTLVNSLLVESYLGKRITDTEYKLLILLKSYTFGKLEVYPTIETIALKMGKKENTISKALKQLEYKLYLKRSYLTLDNGKTKIVLTLKY